VDVIKNSSENEKKEFAQEWSNTTNSNRMSMTRAVAIGVIVLACFAGIALVLFSWLKGKKCPSKDCSHDAGVLVPKSGSVSGEESFPIRGDAT